MNYRFQLNIKRAFAYFRNRHSAQKSTNGWWIFECPMHWDDSHRKKMAVNFDAEIVKCWSCEWRGSIMDFVMEYEDVKYFDAKQLINTYEELDVDTDIVNTVRVREESNVELPYGYMPIMDGNDTLAKRARKYMTDRGFELAVLDELGVGYCCEEHEDKNENYFGYIILPFRKRGKLMYFIGRDFIGNFLKYKNPAFERFGIGKADLLFNEDALEYKRTVCVLEGYLDALTLSKAAVATLGWSLSNEQKNKLMRSECEDLVFVPDVGFYQQAVKTALPFIGVKSNVYVLNFDIPELSDYGKDVNQVGRKRVLAAIKKLEPMTFEQAIEIISN